MLSGINPSLLARLQREVSLPSWIRAVIAFDAAVLEEIIFRLLVLSAVFCLISAVGRIGSKIYPAALFWLSNLLVAVLFGAAHLPSWAGVGPLTPGVVIAVLFINGFAALVLGYTYWKWGIFAAIAMHFAADLTIHGIGPVFL